MPVEATDVEPLMTRPLTSILPTHSPRPKSSARWPITRRNARLDPAPQPNTIESIDDELDGQDPLSLPGLCSRMASPLL